MGEEPIKVHVDRALCIGAGNCTRLARGVFVLDDEEVAVVRDVLAAPPTAIQRAVRSCPSGAISLEQGVCENGAE